MNPLSNEEYYYKVDNMVLSSCQLLRKVFQTRWKEESGMDWEHSEEQGKKFIEGHGQVAFNKAMKAQKDIISKGCIDDWDISVLSTILLNFGYWRNYKSENDAVRQLTTLRNDMAHHPSKKLNLEEYNAKVELFRSSLKGLGVPDEISEELITKAGRSSSVAALKATKRQFDRAKSLMKNNKFENAIGCYDEAITMPSLLVIHQATAYEKRAECFLKFAEFKKLKQLSTQEVNKCCDQAIKDASRTLEINESSWKAHFTLAQAHRLKGELDRAAEHYCQSLAISPVQQHVKNEYDCCKALREIKSGSITHVDPNTLPMNLNEKLAQYSEQFGRNITEEEFLEGLPKAMGAKVPGQDFLARGHQFRCGWGVAINEIEAVRYFSKAAEAGNPEGMHSLALCYINGTGVKQDFSKAHELYLKGAQMSPTTSGRATLVLKNVGVSACQEGLGALYEAGIVVEQNYTKAAFWYKKSAENGEGRSAYRMGLFYCNGWGVPRNEKMAEFYWTEAIRFKVGDAAHALVTYYKHHMEPEKALNMYETGRKLREPLLSGISKDEFMAEINEITTNRERQKPELLAFEKLHKLDVKGLTFMDRLRRMLNTIDGQNDGDLLAPVRVDKKDWRGKFVDATYTNDLAKNAAKGSTVAVGMLKSLSSTAEVVVLMETCLEGKALNNEAGRWNTLNLLYNFITNDYEAVGLPNEMLRNVHKISEGLFKSVGGIKGDADMKARLCFVGFSLKLDDVKRGVELLTEGLKMYPDNVNYFILLDDLYDCLEDHESGFTIVEKGLEKFPDNLKLLHSKAIHVGLLVKEEKDIKKAINAVQDFLSKAPEDHPSVPEAYYLMACTYAGNKRRIGSNCPSDKDKGMIEHYFKLGMEAERNMLSCFMPYECLAKKSLETLRQPSESESDSKAKCLKASAKPTTAIATQQAGGSLNSVLQRKLYLGNPMRQRLILGQRGLINEMIHLPKGHICSYVGMEICMPLMTQSTPKKLSKLKPITLKEMSPMTEAIYPDTFIDLTIVDEPNLKLVWIQLIAEDENGDVAYVFINDMDRNKEDLNERFKFGRRLAILNPYMQVRNQEKDIGIRVDNQDCIVFLSGAQNMCRFCGEENAALQCGQCKKAGYCSKECQLHDWKILKHKLICSEI
ncbi:unnamed protein product [Orchesella dallaii]|uniref:MYND-type domain-containing protein n=1 Tax=Orchesella dallaii TaxID=48710 RepID=A0ABP1RB48_9HEXA